MKNLGLNCFFRFWEKFRNRIEIMITRRKFAVHKNANSCFHIFYARKQILL